MAKQHTPFRYDYVGSFLRPEALKTARRDFEAGKIDAGALRAAEDRAITDLVRKQQAAGYRVITDGEFRRATWHLDFMWGFNGIGHAPTERGLPFHGEAAKIDDTFLTGRLSVGDTPLCRAFPVCQGAGGRKHRRQTDHPRSRPVPRTAGHADEPGGHPEDLPHR